MKVPHCPNCKIKMKEEFISRSFGNPIVIAGKIQTFQCKRCGFEVISETEYEKIRKKLNEKCIKEAEKKAKYLIV